MQKTILIVDFEQESSEELQQILRGEDFLVVTAADGHQALTVFEATKPDLVLTEALLPKLNGFELCKKITAGELRDVRPVIMYSAIYKGEKYQKEAVSGCGAFEFLDKPIPRWQLLKSVRSAFQDRPKPDQVTQPLPEAAPASPSLAGQTQTPRDAGDLLGVDSLFDAPAEAPEPVVGAATETVVLETPPVASKPLMPSIDSKEIDAALDAVRMDLHQEAHRRDELLAQQFEREIQQGGQSILEFEANVAGGLVTPEATQPEESHKEFELDEVLPQIPSSSSAAPFDSATRTTASAPSFAIKPAPSRNWLPIIILVLLVLLAAGYFWLQR